MTLFRTGGGNRTMLETVPGLIQGRRWSRWIPWRIHLLLDNLAAGGLYSRSLPLPFSVRREAARATLLFGGDLALHHWKPEQEPSLIFGEVRSVFADAHLRVVNLETVLTPRDQPSGRVGSFMRGGPGGLRALEYLGVDVVCCANNHALDFGSEGLADCGAHLDRHGIGWFGVRDVGPLGGRGTDVGSDPGVPGAHVREVCGIKVGLLGATDHFGGLPGEGGPTPVWADPAALEAGVRHLAATCDIVVVHLHWGYEYVMYPLRWHRDFARRLVDLGAHVVCCHHAHVTMGWELWGHGVIAHGLGNFFFGWTSRTHPLKCFGLLLRVSVNESGVVSARLLTVKNEVSGQVRLQEEAPPGFGRLCQGLADDSFLDRVQAKRLAYELSRIVTELSTCLSKGDRERLRERRAYLRAPRQEWLMKEATASEDRAWRDAGKWLREIRDLSEEALPNASPFSSAALGRLYRNRDARCLVGRLP